jgi:large subunit ribosomal protein L6
MYRVHPTPNMVTGVTEGFQKTLDLVGVGYRVQQSGQDIILQVGFSHPVNIKPLPGVTLEVEGNNRIHVRGCDKQTVGEVAAQIRKVRPPNAYTGKGVRYSDERVRLKPGKSASRAG